MTTRISPTLVSRDVDGHRSVCCAECGHNIAPTGSDEHWKDHALLKVEPVSELPGWSTSVHPDLVWRKFVCTGCGHLLDSEMALQEDPFLYDVIDG